ncbi:hypothetical protein ABPG75_012565 [Micractinium tetrahymenae]
MDIASLTSRCRDELEQNGFALVEGLLAAKELEELQLEANTLYELAQEGQATAASPAASGASSRAGPAWGADALASCIFETLPGHRLKQAPALRRDAAAYRQRRSAWPLHAGVWRLLFRSRLTELVLALLGSGAVLLNDQYILKPPAGAGGSASASSFAWHHDSDWCRGTDVAYQPYLSVWCALDDTTTANGCLVVRPGSHRLAAACSPEGQQDTAQQGVLQRQGWQSPPVQSTQQQQQQQRQQQQQQQQQLCCSEEEQESGAPALALEVPAGTAIITSDRLLHASGANCTQHFRRAWMPQFSAGALSWRGTGLPVSLAIPLRPSANVS